MVLRNIAKPRMFSLFCCWSRLAPGVGSKNCLLIVDGLASCTVVRKILCATQCSHAPRKIKKNEHYDSVTRH